MQTSEIEHILEKNIKPELENLEEVFDNPISNETAHDALTKAVSNMESDVKKGLSNIQNINERINQLDIHTVPATVKKAEDFR